MALAGATGAAARVQAAEPGYGAITGRVKYESAPGVSAEDAGAAGDALVYVTGFDEPAPAAVVRLSQKDRRFHASVIAVTRGQTVEFRNEDKIMHNVFSTSEAKAFDLGLTRGDEAPTVTFNKTGVLNVYCNIHPEMLSTILVLPNRAFATVKPDGTYRIDKIPPGEHVVRIWHRLADPASRPVRISAGGAATVDWTLPLVRPVPPHLDKNGRPYKQNRTHY